MSHGKALSPGDEWPYHYRGFSLQASPDGEVWWQLYQGTDRLVLEPAPEDVVDELLKLKRIGGRMHVTEEGDVLTRVEAEDDEYDQIYLGTVDDLSGELIPQDSPEYSIDLRPEGLEPGDLWPSVYDGSRYSFVGDRFWWHSGDSHKRHPVPDGLPNDVQQALRRYKPEGGSFRVLPWGDVITLVSLHPTPDKVAEQFNELPRVVRNIIKLRKNRDVEMLPVYVGSLDGYRIEVEEPTSLTDDLSAEEQESLASWAENLGRTSDRSTDTHSVSRPSEDTTGAGITESSNQSDYSAVENEAETKEPGTNEDAGSRARDHAEPDDKESDGPRFNDDPLEWMRDNLDGGDDGMRGEEE